MRIQEFLKEILPLRDKGNSTKLADKWREEDVDEVWWLVEWWGVSQTKGRSTLAADLDRYEKGVLTEFVQLDGCLRSLAALGLFTGITSGNQPVFVFSQWPKINILVDIF